MGDGVLTKDTPVRDCPRQVTVIRDGGSVIVTSKKTVATETMPAETEPLSEKSAKK